MKRITQNLACALAAGLCMMVPAGAAQAQARGYVLNGDGWMALKPQDRAVYAQGLNDAANFFFVNDDLETAVAKVARNRCLIENKTTPNILADIITMGYTRQPQLMRETPLYVYVVRLSEICRPIINEERVRMGLPAI